MRKYIIFNAKSFYSSSLYKRFVNISQKEYRRLTDYWKKKTIKEYLEWIKEDGSWKRSRVRV